MLRIELVEGGQVAHAATPGAAGLDLYARESASIGAGGRALVPCGIKAEIPPGYCGMVCSRSGLALKHGVFVLNAPGIIDSDYRGEIGAILQNAGSDVFAVMPGDRIAQLLIVPIAMMEVRIVESLSSTERGAHGFGSTGA